MEGSEVSKGNFAVLGLMNPGIEIWDLNAYEPVEPVLTLKGHSQSTTSL